MEEQAGEVQAVFRAANERLRERFEALTFEGDVARSSASAQTPGACRCWTYLTLSTNARGDENRYIVAPGHDALAETG